jgi:hypothetical protein
VDFVVDPALGYTAEHEWNRRNCAPGSAPCLNGLLRQATDTVVWAHNLGIARNLILGAELARACARHRVPLIAHHHDWWFDNRWQRWPELQPHGARSLAQVAPRPSSPALRSNTRPSTGRTAQLRRHLGNAANWLPNLAGPLRAPAAPRSPMPAIG